MSTLWQVPLDNPPKVVAMGRNAHGFEPTDSYCLPDLWSLHLFNYDAILRLGESEFRIKPGSLGITPPGVTMSTQYFGISVHIYVHFKVAHGEYTDVPAVCDTGKSYEMLTADLFDAVQQFASNAQYANSVVWSTLWKAARIGASFQSGKPTVHRAVRIASEIIESNLNNKIYISDLADEAQVSAGYLSKLFSENYNESIAEHIKRRRMEKASDLLRHSTLPVKLVASSVGFSDLQQFNKAVRSYCGMSPRAWRNFRDEKTQKEPDNLPGPF